MDDRLSHFTTFRLGGPCRELATVADVAAAAEVIRAWNAAGLPWRIMGGGSNLLVADAGIPECVLRISADRPAIHLAGKTLCVSAATPLDALAEFAADQGLAGLGFAAGIPGTVGGGICGNAGAFGRQLGDVLARVEVLTRLGERQMLDRAALGFGYRFSALPSSGAVVLKAWFQLAPGDRAALRTEREEILALRRAKHPDWRTVPTAGSFFKNLPPAQPGEPRRAAGKFLDDVGAKALRVGGACVFAKHANIVVAGPGATARDVASLAERMAAAVRARFGFDLEPEVRFWGAV